MAALQVSEGSLDTAYSFLGDSFFSQDEDDPTRQTSSTSSTSVPLFCIRRELRRMGRWRRISTTEKAVWKLIACPASNGALINHFLKQLDGGMTLKGLVTRAREQWQKMSPEMKQFFVRVQFYPDFAECMA